MSNLFEVRRWHGVTTLRLGAGGFAPGEVVWIYAGTDTNVDPKHHPLRVVRADKTGALPLWPVLQVRGTPKVRLVYTLIGLESYTRATALYVPPGPRQP